MKRNLLAIILLLGLTSCVKHHVSPYNWYKIADTAQTSLNLFWSADNKYFLSSNTSSDWANYWPNAHGLDALTDGYLRTASPALKKQMSDLISGVYAKNNNSWLVDYYDDEEWMALAFLRAYKATNDKSYKTITDILWADIKGGWSNDLGGGIWWRKDKSSKNTPSNMPAAILAARLYAMDGNAADLEWAKKIYNWQKSTLYENASGLVYDNITKGGVKNTYWKFTYNQGTFLGAALELYKITKDVAYLDDAIKAADYTLYSGFLTSDGILKDEGGGDGGLFKGVFVRYFNRLIIEGGLQVSKQKEYISFQRKCAVTLWSKGTNKTNTLFGSAWDTPPGKVVDFTVQLSGVFLFEAMAELEKDNLVE